MGGQHHTEASRGRCGKEGPAPRGAAHYHCRWVDHNAVFSIEEETLDSRVSHGLSKVLFAVTAP